MKNFFASKINILSIIAMITGLSDFIGNYNFSDITVKGWITFGLGLLTMICRTWYTSTQISGVGNTPK